MSLVGFLLTGLLVGIAAQFLVRGPHGLGCVGTIALGVIGSVVGGSLWSVLFGQGFEVRSGGLLASIFGAVVVLVLARLIRGDDRSRPRPM